MTIEQKILATIKDTPTQSQFEREKTVAGNESGPIGCGDVKFVCLHLYYRGLRFYKFFKEKFQMVNSFKLVSFPTESKVQIGKTTYLINSYFDKTGESLKEKIKNLLVSEIHREPHQMRLHEAKKI